MNYKIFAVAVLVGAPLIVSLAQNVTQHTAPQAVATPAPVNLAPVNPPPVTAAPSTMPQSPIMPSAPPPLPPTPPPGFAGAYPGAGEPMLAPGRGLPDTTAPASNGVEPPSGR